jgi:predicted RNA-binding protein Jag
MEEAMEGIQRVQSTGQQVELAPQNSYVRRLQHQLVEQHELHARSIGSDPTRRLVILAPSAGTDDEE